MNQQWMVQEANFDNIIQSMVTIFIISTQENWPTIMYYSMDANTSDIGPLLNCNTNIAYFYVISLFILNFFLINLFVGVLCDHFIKARENNSPERLYFVSPEQQRWIQYQQLLIKIKPLRQNLTTTNRIRLKFHKIIQSSYFDGFLVVCIFSNIVTLSLNYEGSSRKYDSILDNINYFFTGIFIGEFVVKIIALGPRMYLESNWNKLDLFIVLSSLAEIFMSFVFDSSHSFLRVGPQIIRIFRVLRVTRVFKLIKKFKGLQKLIEALIEILPSIFNLGTLYLLIFFIYAILGVFLFQNITSGQMIDEYYNYSNVVSALITLFCNVTGESWWVIMFDCSSSIPLAPIFFISFQIIAGFIVQNLFILIIIETLEYTGEDDELEKLQESLENFKINWRLQAKNDHPFKINEKKLIPFLKGLNKPLGFGNSMSKEQIGIEIMRMNLPTDMEFNVDFYDVLFMSFKRIYGRFDADQTNPQALEYLKDVELTSRQRIKRLVRRYNNWGQLSNGVVDFVLGLLKGNKQAIHSRFIRKKYVNPIMRILWTKMLFKSWMVYSKCPDKQ